MLQFKTQELRDGARELGLTEESLAHCYDTRDLVEAEARLETLKKTLKDNFKRLALELHPDRNPDGAQHFAKISNAYQEAEAFLNKIRICVQPDFIPVQPFQYVRVVFGASPYAGTSSTSSTVFGTNWWAR